MATENVDFAPDEVNIKVPRGAAWNMEVEIEGTDVTGMTLYGYVRESSRVPEDEYATIDVSVVSAGVDSVIRIGQTDSQIAGEYYVNMKSAPDQPPTTILLGVIGLKEIGQKS